MQGVHYGERGERGSFFVGLLRLQSAPTVNVQADQSNNGLRYRFYDGRPGVANGRIARSWVTSERNEKVDWTVSGVVSRDCISS